MMSMLIDEPRSTERDGRDEWSPTKGLVRALFWGTVVAVLIAGVLAIPAVYAPRMLLGWERVAVAFGSAWILFAVVHRAAGMVSYLCTGLVIVLTCMVLLSHHAIFAAHGIPTSHGVVAGSCWFELPLIVRTNWVAMIGLGACCFMCHDGGNGMSDLVSILGRGVWGSRR